MLKFCLIYFCFSLVTAWPQRGYDQSEDFSGQGLYGRRLGNVSPQLRYRRQQETEPQNQRILRPVRKIQKQPQAIPSQNTINSITGNRQLRPVEQIKQTRRNERPNRLRTQQTRNNEENKRPNNQQFRRNEEKVGPNVQQTRRNEKNKRPTNQQFKRNDKNNGPSIQKTRRNGENNSSNNQQFRRNEENEEPSIQQTTRNEENNKPNKQQFRRNEENNRPNSQQNIRREGQKPVNQNTERSWDIERSEADNRIQQAVINEGSINEQAEDRSPNYEVEERSSFYEDQESSPSYNAEERSSSYGSIPPPPEQAKIEAAVAAGAAGYNAESYTEPQRLQFQIHGQGGPNSYRFGYDTGVGYNRQFRYEERDQYGVLHGRYGYYDQAGKLQITTYTADPEKGFQADGDHVPKPQY